MAPVEPVDDNLDIPRELASGSTGLPSNTFGRLEPSYPVVDRAEWTSNREAAAASSVTQSEPAAVAPEDEVAAVPGVASWRRPSMLIGVVAVLVSAIALVVVMRGSNKSESGKRASHAQADGSGAGSSGTDEHALADSRPLGESRGGSQMHLDEKTTAHNAGVGSAVAAGSDSSTTDATESTTDSAGSAGSAGSGAGSGSAVPPKRPLATLGGKKVVLEYDTPTAPKDLPKKPAVATADDASIGAARITYYDGNRKLFAGDADAAIRLYRQALALYPGYVAGYRGLGLAYAQKGDKANALKALRTYINAVPHAKDVALVKKRIATLQR